MASGSQNMTTYLAKGLQKVLTTGATNTDNLLYINTTDTNITADILGTSNSIAFTRMDTTGADTTGHIVWLNAADIGTPFQLVIHDSSDLYFYKRYKSDGTWSAWTKMKAGTADTWTTARTLTVGGTGKSVDGSTNVSWSMDEIMGSSDSSTFYRGDKTWTNTISNEFKIVRTTTDWKTGATLTFNTTMSSTTGYSYIASYQTPTATTYNDSLVIVATGGCFIGGGEGAETIHQNVMSGSGTEDLYLCPDGSIRIYTGADSKTQKAIIDSTPSFYPATTETGNIGTSSYKWSNMYAVHFNGFATDVGDGSSMWIHPQSSDEINFGGTGGTKIYFGHRDIGTRAKPTDYYFGGTAASATVRAATFVGALSGNATSATKATQDGSGNTITSYYCTLTTAQTITGTKSWGKSGAGGQLNGAATSGGINSIRIGDDVWLGDCNAGGIMGMKSAGSNHDCGFYMYNGSGTQTGQLFFNTSECQLRCAGVFKFLTMSGGAQNGMFNAVGCGSSYASFNLSSYRLYVNGDGYISGEWRCRVVQNGGNDFISRADAGISSVNTYGNNWVQVRASAFNAQSSRLVKTNIVTMTEEDGYKVLQLRPVNFDFKENFGPKNQSGLIAEEVEQFIPFVVSTPDDYDESKFDESKGINQPIKNIDYSKLVPFIIKLTQLQQTRIEKLEQQLQNLTGERET